jgi:hypothetical protein
MFLLDDLNATNKVESIDSPSKQVVARIKFSLPIFGTMAQLSLPLQFFVGGLGSLESIQRAQWHKYSIFGTIFTPNNR